MIFENKKEQKISKIKCKKYNKTEFKIHILKWNTKKIKLLFKTVNKKIYFY